MIFKNGHKGDGKEAEIKQGRICVHSTCTGWSGGKVTLEIKFEGRETGGVRGGV